MRLRTDVFLLLLVLGVSCFSPSVLAQNSDHGRWFVDPTGAATSAFLFDPPPAGFDPMTASDDDLRDYGFPPKPSVSEGTHYDIWKRLVSLRRIRPEVSFSNISHGGPHVLKQTSDATYLSDNWSGYVLTANSGTFAKNNTYVYGQWSMPAVSDARCGPPAFDDYASQWVGFDGFTGSGAADVLQAGTEASAFCSGGNTTTAYSAWFEWWPANTSYLNFPVSQGDAMIVEVEYFTSGTHGYFMIGDESKSQSVSGYFNPPSGTTYVGDSVEWIVERPSVNNVVSDLADYSTTIFSYVLAENGTLYTPNGPAPPGGAIYNVTMFCPPWNPPTDCTSQTDISKVSLQVEGENEFLTFNPFPPAK